MSRFTTSIQVAFNTLIGLAIILVFSANTRGTHMLSADLKYFHMGGNTYKITYTAHRDCSGIPIGTSDASLIIRLDSCGPIVINRTMSYLGFQIAEPYCDLVGNGCGINNRVNSEAHSFETIVNFDSIPNTIGGNPIPKRYHNWYLSVNIVARPILRNISNFPGLYTTTILNNSIFVEQGLGLISIDNNSPINLDQEIGIRYVCPNRDASIPLAVFDPDGDSLSYELFSGKSECNVLVAYNTLDVPVLIDGIPYPAMPFTGNSPMPSFRLDSSQGVKKAAPYCYLNPRTGVLQFKPIIYIPNSRSSMGLNKYLLSFIIKEYRKIGSSTIIVGQTHKDITVVVEDCGNNTPPPLPTATLTNGSNAQISVDSIITLKLPTCNYSEIDLSFIDSANSDLRLFLKYTNHNIERFLGGPFLYSIIQGDSSSNPKIKLVFQPDASMVDNHYSLILRVEKNSCPLKITKDYFLRIIIEDKSFGEIRSPIDRAIVGVCEGDPLPLTAIANRPDSTADAPASYRYKWDLASGLNPADTNQAAIIVRPTTETRYRVSITNLAMGACTDTASILVKVKPYPSNLRNLGVNGARAVAQGPNLIYRWYDMSNRLVGTTDTFTSHNPGQFYLEVTDTSYGTHCMVRSADFLLLTNGKSLGSYFKLYPNPASNTVKIEGLTEESSITFINSVGQKIEFNRINAAQINISSLKPGLYIVEAKHHGQVFRQHLIIEN